MNLNKVLFFSIIIAIAIFACNCSSTQTRIKNNEIDNTISGLKNVASEETNVYKKTVVNDAINKLETAKEINIENSELKEQIESNEKFVKAGKFVYAGIGLFVIVAVGLIVFKIFKPFS